MELEDIAKPCRYLAQELNFNKELNNKNKTKGKYLNMDINELIRFKSKGPIEIQIKGGQNQKLNISNFCLASVRPDLDLTLKLQIL